MVLAGSEVQFEAARRSRESIATHTTRPVLTEVSRLDRFYVAEDYHQKHALKRDRLLSGEMHAHYPDEAAFRESTAAARLNGYAYGFGSSLQLEREIETLGLSEKARDHLRAMVRR